MRRKNIIMLALAAGLALWPSCAYGQERSQSAVERRVRLIESTGTRIKQCVFLEKIAVSGSEQAQDRCFSGTAYTPAEKAGIICSEQLQVNGFLITHCLDKQEKTLITIIEDADKKEPCTEQGHPDESLRLVIYDHQANGFGKGDFVRASISSSWFSASYTLSVTGGIIEGVEAKLHSGHQLPCSYSSREGFFEKIAIGIKKKTDRISERYERLLMPEDNSRLAEEAVRKITSGAQKKIWGYIDRNASISLEDESKTAFHRETRGQN